MPTFCYAINATDGTLATYPELLNNSLASLSRFVDPSDVVIIYTPPRDHNHIETLRERGYNVLERKSLDIPNGAAMKLHLCDIDADELVFFDADTVVMNDPTMVFGHDFTFASRPDAGLDDEPPRDETLGDAPVTVYSTGFMAFTDGLHQRLGANWERYWRELNTNSSSRYNEMVAFALALRSIVDPSEIFELDETHQAIERRGENPAGAYVHELQRLNGRSWSEIRTEVGELG